MKKATESKPASNGAKTATKSSPKTSGVKAKPDAADELRELFEDELKDIYWAEKALVKALPKMAKNATSPELVAALEEHLAVTIEQVKRVEAVFAAIKVKPEAKTCQAMLGLIKEGEEIMEGTTKGLVRDAGIISAAQKVEHYEIASYGTLCAFAKTLGEDEAGTLLHTTLEEEKQSDNSLTEIAESFVNSEAL